MRKVKVIEAPINHAPISAPEHRKTVSPIQVLQVLGPSLIADQDDDYLREGIKVCHAHLVEALQQIRHNNKQIDAVIVSPECFIADIMSIREVTDQKAVPLILHTEKFEWKAKEIALESGVDEYHVGFLDQSFIKRVKLIEQVKYFKSVNGSKQQLGQQPDERPPLKFWFLKRTLDITIASIIILLLSPTLLVILSLLLFETKGSVLCRSKRVGKNYKIFDLYKFRCSPSGLGQFLREARLEGLPQVLNVLAGDMSLVGNCPIHLEDAEQLTADGIAWRFLAPAGMVGLWQFKSKAENELSNELSNWECTKLDIEYAMTNTMWLDVRIMCGYLMNLVAARRNRKVLDWRPQHPSVDKLMANYRGQNGYTVSTH